VNFILELLMLSAITALTASLARSGPFDLCRTTLADHSADSHRAHFIQKCVIYYMSLKW